MSVSKQLLSKHERLPLTLKVLFKVKGVEKTFWEREHTHNVYNSSTKSHTTVHEWHMHGESRKFFEAKVQLYAWPQTCVPGQYQFPFSFVLPRGLPGSFVYEKGYYSSSRNIRCMGGA
jgi:hypothetical protein